MPKKGIVLPKLGMADALFSRTQQRVLGLLFGQPDRLYGTVELIKLAESGSGAVQRELARLVASGLVQRTEIGKYQANRASPIFDELHSIVEKTAGVPDAIRAALAPLAPKIQFAVLYGSVAKATDTATSDIDVLIVADEIALEAVFEALGPAEQRLGRAVSPTLYTSVEFRKRQRANQPFLTKVLRGKHVVVIGAEDSVLATR